MLPSIFKGKIYSSNDIKGNYIAKRNVVRQQFVSNNSMRCQPSRCIRSPSTIPSFHFLRHRQETYIFIATPESHQRSNMSVPKSRNSPRPTEGSVRHSSIHSNPLRILCPTRQAHLLDEISKRPARPGSLRRRHKTLRDARQFRHVPSVTYACVKGRNRTGEKTLIRLVRQLY